MIPGRCSPLGITYALRFFRSGYALLMFTSRQSSRTISNVPLSTHCPVLLVSQSINPRPAVVWHGILQHRHSRTTFEAEMRGCLACYAFGRRELEESGQAAFSCMVRKALCGSVREMSRGMVSEVVRCKCNFEKYGSIGADVLDQGDEDGMSDGASHVLGLAIVCVISSAIDGGGWLARTKRSTLWSCLSVSVFSALIAIERVHGYQRRSKRVS
jgi:hypothetical protein